jgi:hypothetical protein
MPMSNPYEALPPTAFWRPSVGQREPRDIDQLWTAKFPITASDRIITAGSCFAQHIGRTLTRAGYSWCDAEPAPPNLSEDAARRFNYGVFSFRTGNIYTVALLQQWIGWAVGVAAPSSEIWMAGGRFYDPFRPTIEPGGFASEKELVLARTSTLQAIRDALGKASLFVFTLGLTEGWRNKEDSVVYPVCPGTAAGNFDPNQHEFHNYRYDEIHRELQQTIELVRSVNPKIRFLLTVSPVPLVATASSQHVLVATVHSKSTLRAVAGDVAADCAHVDYFPSYEMISSFPFRGMFYESNLRDVTADGVECVMQSFFAGLASGSTASVAEQAPPLASPPIDAAAAPPVSVAAGDDLVCEELILDAFSRTPQ